MLSTLLAMDPLVITAFMAAAFVLYVTPGADMMFTIASGVAGGPKAGVAAAVGISTGVLAHVCLAAAGLAAIVAASPVMLDVIRWIGAAYLLWLAVTSWRAAGRANDATGRTSVWQAARRGFVTNILNPKVGLFVLAFLPQFADPNIGPIWHQILIFGTFQAVGGVFTSAVFGIFAGVLADRVRNSARVMNKISAVIFGGLAVRLAWN